MFNQRKNYIILQPLYDNIENPFCKQIDLCKKNNIGSPRIKNSKVLVRDSLSCRSDKHDSNNSTELCNLYSDSDSNSETNRKKQCEKNFASFSNKKASSSHREASSSHRGTLSSDMDTSRWERDTSCFTRATSSSDMETSPSGMVASCVTREASFSTREAPCFTRDYSCFTKEASCSTRVSSHSRYPEFACETEESG
jgi:hypothetical protein